MTRPVVFIHGLWLHGTSWQPWIDCFRAEGYSPFAPEYPGEAPTVAGTRARPDSVADYSLDELTGHYRDIIELLSEPPILIGHSIGGVVVQKLLSQGFGAAGVALSSAQIQGVRSLPLSQLTVGLPMLANPRNVTRSMSLTFEQFRYGFANAVSAEEARELFDAWTVPSTLRPLFQTSLVDLQLRSEAAVNLSVNRGPLLLVAGGLDRMQPRSIAEATLKQYRQSRTTTDIEIFESRGHSLVIDSGWSAVADRVLAWLGRQGLRPSRQGSPIHQPVS
jgi:pimeloyl-ACP methyl ester carboxylesterase